MEETKVSELYKKGFNQAYMLSKNMPEVLKGMQIPSNEPSEYTKGFADGQKQHEKERGLAPHQKPKDRNYDMGLER